MAARLIGWRIDIKSEEEKKLEVQSQMDAMAATQTSLSILSGLGEKTVERLAEQGFSTVEEIASLEPDSLTEIPGIGAKTAEKIVAAARDYLASLPPLAERPAEKAAEEVPPVENPALVEATEEPLPAQIGEIVHERQSSVGEPESEGSGGER